MRRSLNAPFNFNGSDADCPQRINLLHNLYGFLTKPSCIASVTAADTAFFRVISLFEPSKGFCRVWLLYQFGEAFSRMACSHSLFFWVPLATVSPSCAV